MNPLTLFLAGGDGFYIGLLLFSIGLVLGRKSRPLYRILATLSALVGAILIVVSTTPISILWYGLALVSTTFWIVSIRSSRTSARWQSLSIRLMLLTIAAGLILEVPHDLSPRIPKPAHRRLVILADSITAGLHEDDRTWPMRLRERVDYEIVDLSHVGALMADGTDMLASNKVAGDLVLIELGGNDLLGDTSPDEFHRGLEELLQQLATADCTVVMFELPLPPFDYRYGYSQRSLAARYHVSLIPKRCLLSILIGERKTFDSIHLADEGHQQMAEFIQHLLSPAMEGETSN